MHTLEFDLGMIAIKSRKPVREVIKALQDHWNLPRYAPNLRKAAGDDDGSSTAGNHDIPEIGRQEAAFYNALTAGQKEAYAAIRELVNRLHESKGGWAGINPWDIDEPIDQWKDNAFYELATHPMRAYMVGQMLATDAIDNGLARPVLPTDTQAIEFLNSYAFNEIQSAFDNMKSDLRNALIQGMQRGDNPREVTRALHDTISGYEIDWDLIAITETARAESQGRLNELTDQGYEYAIGSSAHDSRTCEDCLRLVNDVVVDVKDTVGVSNYGRKKADWVTCIPLHPRCRCVWLPYSQP
jgi:hypothetical protein